MNIFKNIAVFFLLNSFQWVSLLYMTMGSVQFQYTHCELIYILMGLNFFYIFFSFTFFFVLCAST